ncbi:GNAT family N-acetyltransferase [Vibrio fluvialis]|nr:GNAT family N-acetyltransferase [Vibrio fluvialis]
MPLRKAKVDELDTIYAMGFDVWNGGLGFEQYLAGCRDSGKYRSGTWYVLAQGEQIVASLIVYSRMFGLEDGCFGIGSLATLPEQRNKGYGAEIVNLVKAELFNNQQAKAIYLHCNIDHRYYEKLGFCRLQGSDCMCISADPLVYERPLPAYF